MLDEIEKEIYSNPYHFKEQKTKIEKPNKPK